MALWSSGALLWLFCGIFGYFSLILLAICISSALYLLAELAEEYPSHVGNILKNVLFPVVIGLHLVLWIDGLPFLETFLGLASHGCYYLMLQHYPLLKLNSYEAPLSLFMFVISHYFWFVFFTDPMNYNLPGRDLLHLVGFFVVLVWSVPFGLFISLTISDNILPGIHRSSGSNDHLNRESNGAGFVQAAKGKGANAFKTFYDFFQHIIESIASYSYTGAGKAKRYKNPGGVAGGSGSSTGAHGGNYLSGSNNPMASSQLYTTGGGYSGSGDSGGGSGGAGPQQHSASYPYVTPQPSGQYAASQFVSNRAQSTGAFQQAYPTFNKKAE